MFGSNCPKETVQAFKNCFNDFDYFEFEVEEKEETEQANPYFVG